MTKALTIFAVGFLMVAPFSASACGGYFSMCDQYGREQRLVVYAWGPGTTAQSPFNNYNQPSYYQPSYQPQQNYYQPVYQQYQPTYYQPQYTYNQPTYNYYQPTYNAQPTYIPQGQYYYQPQYDYNYYDQQPYFGYSAQPTGQRDFWGNNLCNWGDYQGYSCDRDPHQWIQDSATGEWY